jgi:hypothetical protein
VPEEIIVLVQVFLMQDKNLLQSVQSLRQEGAPLSESLKASNARVETNCRRFSQRLSASSSGTKGMS